MVARLISGRRDQQRPGVGRPGNRRPIIEQPRRPLRPDHRRIVEGAAEGVAAVGPNPIGEGRQAAARFFFDGGAEGLRRDGAEIPFQGRRLFRQVRLPGQRSVVQGRQCGVRAQPHHGLHGQVQGQRPGSQTRRAQTRRWGGRRRRKGARGWRHGVAVPLPRRRPLGRRGRRSPSGRRRRSSTRWSGRWSRRLPGRPPCPPTGPARGPGSAAPGSPDQGVPPWPQPKGPRVRRRPL